MATKKKKSFKEWYEENYSGDKSEDKSESKNEDIAPIAPPTGDFFTFSTNKNKPIQNADIAPAPNGAEELRNQQKEAKQEQQKGFLNKGNAFSDGYQFGDITKTRRATTADIILSMAEGAGGLVEGITDWAAYGIAQAGEKIDPDAEWTKILREGAMQNTLADASAVRNLTGVDEYSLIGNRSRSVARAVGQILTQMGAAAAGAQVGIDPALVNNAIMYLSSTGGGMTQAYNEGATDEEAALYGMISGAVNVLSEMLFAGLGKAAKAFGVGKGSGIDDYVAKKLTDKIGNRILRNGLQYSVKAGAEGLEEVVAGSLEAVGKKLTYEDEKSMKELLEDEQLFEQFMTSALASGTMQGADLATSIKEGSDFVTGETKEQMAANKDAETVVKTLADERIAAEEKAGKRLTEKDKREIRKEIETAMERGELNIDDIERIVGGDEYKNYKAELERQEQIRNEKREILKTPVNKFTVEQQERLAELRAMKTDKSMVDSLKSSLDERVAKATAPGSRLSESYTQRAARGQKFEADLSKYSKEEAAIVKKAVESGYLNNTRATHELVDFVAKMCARKGISFDFLTNEKLKESGFSVDGATVNGYWDKSTKTIGLNMNSKKAFKTVIGHEMAHVLEDTDLYKDFKDTITEYAKLKGDYEGRLEQLKKIYKNKPDADVERELVADLVGDYLFTDEAFLKRLSVENRNVFQKLWDEVKYLHRLATVGSEQARELERIKHMFEKVFEETKVDQAVSKDAEVEHSLTRNKELMDDAIAKNNELFGIDLDTAQKQRQTIYDYMTKHAAELKLPPDAEGNTAFKNSSYDFSEENTTVCIRSMAADALCDAVAEDLGRPLTVQDTLYISQDLMNYTDAPECVYCYVATDRRAYREFLGSYYKQMTSAIEALKSGKNSKEVYTAFLDGRKDTKNMQKRFAMWQQIAKDGNAISASDLASERNMQEAMRNPLLAAQVKDARAYAQSASWAKKRVGYTAYNGHILEWKQSRINDLNRHYGLRFYSFSDFSPAFILENMQQITDAAVRGLKGLAYTKELDFVKIFAPSGININISVFGYDQNGTVAMDGMMGANWTEAQALRNQYENVGITFVATNDAQIEWALNQDWIDVVIPYHLVRTGQAVAKHFGYTNYTAESGDTKGANWKKGDKKTIYPAEHNNDKQTYLDAIKDANLEPRFARFVDHPNYMKLVNETRRSANNTPPMRPVFNVDAAIESLKTMAQKGGYFVPIGGDYANMQEIAGDIADKIRGNTQFSLSPEADQSYLDAVNRGDTETAQMMVDEAAKEWGAYVKRGRVKAFYHGTKKSFTVFDKEKLSDTLGFFFTEEKAEAQDYGEAYRFYLKIENPIDIWSDEYFMFSQIKSDAEKVKALQEAGYDGIESFSHGILWMIAFEPNQIKSADAVTYDDNGNVIPLSERFNSGNNDIRFSLSAEDEIAPTAGITGKDIALENIAPTREQIAEMKRVTTPKKVDNLPMREDIAPIKETPQKAEPKIAQVLTEESSGKKKGFDAWAAVKNLVLDKGMVFEDLALKTKNRTLQARWNSIRYANSKAQKMIGNGYGKAKALTAIRSEVENSGKTDEFYNYLYHKHNIDRMSLDKNKTAKSLGMKNKPVFGNDVTAKDSERIVAEYEKSNPQFKAWAKDVYDYMNTLREMLVTDGVISRETANLWAELYPSYVPIRRAGKEGLAVNVPLDTRRTGVNAPIRSAKGGNSDIEPLFGTMALRTEQTYRAIARNRFGIELRNTLGSELEASAQGVDETIDSIDDNDSLLKEGKDGKLPTFTVFENGKKVTFEITDEMYNAMKPTNEVLRYRNKVLNTATNIFRSLVTEYNPVFMIKNPIKDSQDVLINSQHPAKTYAAIPKAITEMAQNGKYYKEYIANGGEQNTYFESDSKTFTKEDEGIKKWIGMPLRKISEANGVIERIPRLAEYIASREAGRDIDVSMLDAARVTTNFAAGGDLTKALNRNGFTFLNASVQGAMQNVRNVREAKANGLKGWVQLAAKVTAAGLPALILNALLWDDDEEYDELSDYVKQNYYIIAKFGDGKFVRIPKGRTVAVIQNAFEQMKNLVTGDDDVDMQSFFDLVINNLAPNNPLENNVIAPIQQALTNKTWYGDDLVPARLQDLPAAEQYDESIDSISKWIGEKTNTSPYKWNYVLNQYSGVVGDILLPMLTPESDGGGLLAPFADAFTTDSTMKNQNVTDFYDTVEKLNTSAKSSKATDADVLKYKYMSSVNSEISDLYKTKRFIQNSNLTDKEKDDAVRKLQRLIDDLAKESLESYENVRIDGNRAAVGDKQYKYTNGEWKKTTDDKQAKKDRVVSYLKTLDVDYGEKLIIYRSVYKNDNTYNKEIVEYLSGRDDLSYDEVVSILEELGFTVKNGRVYWD